MQRRFKYLSLCTMFYIRDKTDMTLNYCRTFLTPSSVWAAVKWQWKSPLPLNTYINTDTHTFTLRVCRVELPTPPTFDELLRTFFNFDFFVFSWKDFVAVPLFSSLLLLLCLFEEEVLWNLARPPPRLPCAWMRHFLPRLDWLRARAPLAAAGRGKGKTGIRKCVL